MSERHLVIVCAATDPAVVQAVHAALPASAADQFEVACVEPELLGDRVSEVADSGGRVPLVVVDDTARPFVRSLAAIPWGREIRVVVLSDDPEAPHPSEIDDVVLPPWTGSEVRATIDRLLTGYLIDEQPETLEKVPEVVDVELLTHAFSEVEHRQRRVDAELEEARRGFLAHRGLSDDELESQMIAEIERVMESPARTVYPAGTLLIERGRQVDGVMVVLEGQTRLSLEVDGREIPFHVRTAGRILGILSLARRQPAFFDCRAITDVTVIEIGSAQLDDALQRSSTLAGLFESVLLRSMARRNRRNVEMRLEIDHLARDLRHERDQLAAALAQLDRAQAQLIEQEKMALLGQLVAGVAHELNNPLAAIMRSVEFVEEDITALTRKHPESRLLSDVLLGALRSTPVSTRELRQRRSELADALGDESLASRLVHVGFDSSVGVDRLIGNLDPEQREELLQAVESYHRLGSALRNLRTGAARIAELVHSLRSYARPPGETVSALDVTEGIEETLLLLGHRMRGITVEREYHEVASITGNPGELNQVWTNLIANAIEVMEDQGVLRVSVEAAPGGDVRVEIVDSGPGIPSDDIERIFQLDFTTKQGRVDFGLGLGLRIASDIVRRHGGSIDVESRPGRTCFAVTLPAGGGDG